MKLRVAFLAMALVVQVAGFAACSSLKNADPAPPDAESPDAVAEGDAPPESSSPDATPDGGRFCQRTDASFCADFDFGQLTAGWEPLTTGFVGAIGATPSNRSAPNALLSTAGPYDGGASAVLFRRVAHTAGVRPVVTLDLDVRVDEVSGTASASVASLGFPGTTELVTLQATPNALALTIVDPEGGVTSQPLSRPAGSAWFHLQIEVTLGGSLRVRVDGATSFTGTTPLADRSAAVVVGVGAAVTSSEARANIAYDNVVITER